MRADPGKRWQTAEQMADRIDAILVKLGQPSGPAPLRNDVRPALLVGVEAIHQGMHGASLTRELR